MSTSSNIHIYNEVSCFFIDSSLYNLPIVVYFDTEDIPKVSKHSWQISQVNYKGTVYNIVRNVGTKIRLADVILEGTKKGAGVVFRNGNIFDFRKSNIYYKNHDTIQNKT